MKRSIIALAVIFMVTGVLFAQENVDIINAYLVKSIENDVINQFVVFNIENAVTGDYIDIDESYINISNGLITVANPGLPNTVGVTCYEASGGLYVINTATDEEINRLMVGETLGNYNYTYLWELEGPQNRQLNGLGIIRPEHLSTGTLFFEINLEGYLESNNLFVEEINDPDLIILSTENNEIYNYFQYFQVNFVDTLHWQNREIWITFIYNEDYFGLYAVLQGNFIELDSFEETIITQNGWQRNYQNYLIRNETANNIELSSLEFYLNYEDDEEWRTLFLQNLYLSINNEWYEFILPDEHGFFTVDIDLDLLANSQSYLHYQMSATGYGNIDIRLSSVLINNNEYIYPDIEIHHHIVNTSQNMHDLYSPALHLQEEYQGGYGNGYGNGIEVNMFPGQRWFFYNNLGTVPNNYIENSVVYFIFKMNFYNGIENYHWLSGWGETQLLENGTIDVLSDTEEEYQMYWSSYLPSSGINRASLLNAYITNNILVGQTAHLENNLEVGNYLDNYGVDIDYNQYFITINSNPGIIGDGDGDGDHDSDDTSLSIENAVNHTYENTNFSSTNDVNIARETFMFNWHTGFDPWLDCVFDNDPTNLLVVNIGYGLEYEYESGYGRVGTDIWYEGILLGNILTIATPGNGVSVKYFSDGGWVTDAILLTDREVLRFDSRTITTSIEPTQYPITREENEFVFELPEGHQRLEVSAIITPDIITPVEPQEIIPISESALLGNFPNPFNPSTTISFNIVENSDVELTIYNTKGQKVKTLISDQLSAGQHNVVWNGTDENGKKVTSGIYFYKMESGRYTSTKKMILMK